MDVEIVQHPVIGSTLREIMGKRLVDGVL